MAEPHPVELRERVVWAYESGVGSYPAVAELFGVGEATVKRLSVIADHVWDVYDDSSLGLVTYDPFLTEPSPDAPVP